MVLLLLFGYSFTKINVAGPLYLYDALLFLLASFAVFGIEKLSNTRVILFLLISFIYLGFSIIYNDALIYVVRQYMIVGYLMLTYIIFQCIRQKEGLLLNFIYSLSKWAFFLQIGYLVIVVSMGNSLFGDFNYLSPLSIMLLPVYTARVLVAPMSQWARSLIIIAIVVLSTTLGHSSAFLAVVIVIFGFFVYRIKTKQVIGGVSIAVIALILLYLFLPQFRDVNANWRLFYWGKALEKTASTYFLGNGFGVPYITEPEIYQMVDIFGNDNDLLDSPEEKYIKAYHNSFFTMFFYMGVFVFLLAGPFIKTFGFLKKPAKEEKLKFLVLSFLGVSTWCFFNVVLELPHSSILFWLLFLLVADKIRTLKQPVV